MKSIRWRFLLLALAIYLGDIAGGTAFYSFHNSGRLPPFSMDWFHPVRPIASILMAMVLLSHPPTAICFLLALITSILYVRRPCSAWVWALPFVSYAAVAFATREAWRVG